MDRNRDYYVEIILGTTFSDLWHEINLIFNTIFLYPVTILDIVVNILELTYVSMPIAKHGSLWFENNEKMLCGCQLNLTLKLFFKSQIK